jgi:hypothetical protein
VSGARVPVLTKGPAATAATEAFAKARIDANPVCMTGAPGANPEDWADDGAYEQNAADWCNTVCGIRDVCLRYALETKEPIGVWGGMTAAQRRRLLRTQGKQLLPMKV